MNALTRTNNQRNIMRPWLRDFFDMENLFDGGNWLRPLEKSVPAVNVSEDEKNFIVDVIAPGFKKDDFNVSIDDDMLTISGEAKKEIKDDNVAYNRREYSYNSFTRSFSLPDNAKRDGINASYTDGILKLAIPKNEPTIKPSKTIPIK